MTHGNTKIKFVNAKQAKTYYNYKNNKRKMYRINAAIWYNKKCNLHQAGPNKTLISPTFTWARHILTIREKKEGVLPIDRTARSIVQQSCNIRFLYVCKYHKNIRL